MRDIAAGCGMKSGSLYYYYESKEALLNAILSTNINATRMALSDAVDALPKDCSVRDKFNEAVRVTVKVVINAGDMALASARTLSLLREPEYSEQVRHRQAYNDFWQSLIAEGKARGEIHPDVPEAMASMLIVGALSFLPEWFDGGRSTTDAIADIFSDLFFAGIGVGVGVARRGMDASIRGRARSSAS